MKTMNNSNLAAVNGGKYYRCPWGDYGGTSYWNVYAHAVAHAYRLGIFNFPLWLIKVGIGLG